jgi:hypothetical protein
VVFRPTATGSREGTLQIDSNALSTPTLLHLAGTGLEGAPPRALTLAGTLSFGSRRVGTRSAGMPLDILNNLASAASITELTASGDFAVSDTCRTIPARSHCAPLVYFRPTALGTRTGTLTIRVMSETLPYTVSLAGSGELNPLASLDLSATRVSFGKAFIGLPRTVEITLTNFGQVPVVLGSFSLNGDYFMVNLCGATLGAGAACTLQVTFFASTMGVRAGSLEIGSNAEGSPHHIEFSGVGCTMPTPMRMRAGAALCGT